jgi:hypothetical protein
MTAVIQLLQPQAQLRQRPRTLILHLLPGPLRPSGPRTLLGLEPKAAKRIPGKKSP